MLKTLIVLPDGTELFSGVGLLNAIRSVAITECVNGSQELTLGSTCANMIEVKLITPEGGLSIAAGDELTVYRVDDAGHRYQVGLFTTEKPTRTGAHTLSITAYDRVSWLDKDLSWWLVGLQQWPIRLSDLAQMVCEECGLQLKSADIPNGNYLVRKFSGEGITGRQLMQWIGEIAGRFCRATPDGEIEFTWYTPAAVGIAPTERAATEGGTASISFADGALVMDDSEGEISDDGEGTVTINAPNIQVATDGQGKATFSVIGDQQKLYYFQNSLTYHDYSVAPIEKVQLRQNEEDMGTVYPDIEDEVNTYIITGNYLLTAETGNELVPVAQTLYEHLKGITFTPCKVSIPSNLQICAGNTVQITDRNGKSIIAYVMSRKISGQKDTLECTGSARRDSSDAVNNVGYNALNGKVLNLRKDVEGLKVENKDFSGRLAAAELNLDGIQTQVAKQETTTEGLQQRMSTVEQTAEGVSIAIKSIQENGVDKVQGMGYAFTSEGLKIEKEGAETKGRFDHAGVRVTRHQNDEPVLIADVNGLLGRDVTVENYFIVGEITRIEGYSEDAMKFSAAFFIGGS